MELKKAMELRETERKGRINAERKLKEQVFQERDECGYSFKSIGHVESIYVDRRGAPRQPILVTSGKGRIVFDKHLIQYEHYKELEEFSHIWVLFVFHDNTNADKERTPAPLQNRSNERKKNNNNNRGNKGISAKIAPPRLHGAKVGCLSTRSPHRPNPIGLSVCAIEEVTKDAIIVSGLDMIDGTPVLDIKPYIPYDIIYSTIPVPMATDEDGNSLNTKSLQVPSWIYEYDIPSRKIIYSTNASDGLELIVNFKQKTFYSTMYSNVEDAKCLISQVLRQDIRSVHQGRKASNSQDNDVKKIDETGIEMMTNGKDVATQRSIQQPYEVNIGKLHIEFLTYESHILVKSITDYLGATNNV